MKIEELKNIKYKNLPWWLKLIVIKEAVQLVAYILSFLFGFFGI